MNIRFISYITLIAFSIKTIPAKADLNEEVLHEQTTTLSTAIEADAAEDYDYYEPEGTEVTQSDNSAKKQQRKQMWINIGLAVTAVIVAVTALCLVSNNNGKHYHN